MKTIKERATEYVQNYSNVSDIDSDFALGKITGMKRGYIQGANDQLNIDIEKACAWLKRELGYPMPDELFEQWCDEKLEDFRKEMKGE